MREAGWNRWGKLRTSPVQPRMLETALSRLSRVTHRIVTPGCSALAGGGKKRRPERRAWMGDCAPAIGQCPRQSRRG